MTRTKGAKGTEKRDKDYYISKLKEIGYEVTPERLKEIKAEEELRIEKPEETDYTCSVCGNSVKQNDPQCRHCGEPLSWADL